MGDLAWDLSEDDMAKLYPELEPDQRAEAAENLSRYFKVIGKIYDHLDDKGKLKDALLRIPYEKRNRYDETVENLSHKSPRCPIRAPFRVRYIRNQVRFV